MAATITASPNPVTFSGFFTTFLKKDTTITWNAGGTIRGWVEEYVNGAFKADFDGSQQNPKGQGSKVASIELGQTHEFRVIQNNAAKTLLASVKVTTEHDVSEPPLVVIDALRNTPFQGIYDLKVSPEIESVTITFKTYQSTNPLVMLTHAERGELVGLWARQEKKQVHSIVFEGGSEWLEQDTVFNYRIVADKREAKGTIRTGLRTATFFFDSIRLRHGDSGDVGFQFGVGNAEAQTLLGNDRFEPDGDVDDGETVHVNRVITIPTAPRVLWAQVTGYENNRTAWDFFLNPGFDGFGSFPSFSHQGTQGFHGETWAYADVTQHFNISWTRGGTSTSSFTMPTANFALAYSVSARLRVEAHNGEWITSVPKVTHSLRPREGFTERATRSIGSVGPGQIAVVTAAPGHPHMVFLDPEGAVYHQALEEDSRAWRRTPWTRLGGQFEGPMTVVAAGPERISLFGLSPDGAVLYKTHAPNGGSLDEDWQSLGGEFVGHVTAATGADGAIEVFATSEDGSVFHRPLVGPQREQPRAVWERVGDTTSGSIVALTSPRRGLSLFALGRDGEVLHKRRPLEEQEWWPADREWESLGIASEGSLGAEWAEDDGLILTVIGQDETVRVLAWSAYPEARPGNGWQTVGSIESLLQGRTVEGEAPPVPDRASAI